MPRVQGYGKERDLTEKEIYGIIGSTGEIEVYQDAYANITEENINSIQGFTDYIHEQENTIGGSFLKIGAALLEVEKGQLYKAAGLPSMAVWMQSEKFHMSYEHGTRLMRIVRDLVPVLGVDNLPSVSTLKELLPMVSEGATPEQIREAAEEVSELTIKDAKARLREIRGLEEKPRATLFKAIVDTRNGGNYITIKRYGEDGNNYDVTERGPIWIRSDDWAVWADRFGGMIEYE